MRNALFLLVIILPLVSFAQENSVSSGEITKYDSFTSKTGSIIKFTDINFPRIEMQKSDKLSASIRIVSSGPIQSYFLRLESTIFRNNNREYYAGIEYSDLVEINKALVVLKSDYEADKSTTHSDYIENKFISKDRFEIGYYISDKISWFLQFDGNNSATLYPKNIQGIINLFSDAQLAIEEIMRNGSLSEETRQSIDKYILRQNQLETDIDNKQKRSSSKNKRIYDDDIYY